MERSGTMTEEGKAQINRLLSELSDKNNSTANAPAGSLSERAQKILNSKDLSDEARAKLEALTLSMQTTGEQAENASAHSAEIQAIQAQRRALEAKVAGGLCFTSDP